MTSGPLVFEERKDGTIGGLLGMVTVASIVAFDHPTNRAGISFALPPGCSWRSVKDIATAKRMLQR